MAKKKIVIFIIALACVALLAVAMIIVVVSGFTRDMNPAPMELNDIAEVASSPDASENGNNGGTAESTAEHESAVREATEEKLLESGTEKSTESTDTEEPVSQGSTAKDGGGAAGLSSAERYKSLLEDYCKAFDAADRGDTEYRENFMNKYDIYGDGFYSWDTYGYTFRDIDGDGLDELIVSEYGYITSVYTIKKNQYCNLINGWSRCRVYLLNDNTFYSVGASSASICSYSCYKLNEAGDKEIYAESYILDGTKYEENPDLYGDIDVNTDDRFWFYSTHDDLSSDYYQDTTYKKAQEFIDDCSNRIVELEYKSFRDLDYQSDDIENVDSTNQDWKEAYLELLDQYDSQYEYLDAVLEDIDMDGTPEFFLEGISYPIIQELNGYTYSGGNVKKLSSNLVYGESDVEFFYNERYLLRIDRGQDVGSFEEFDIYEISQGDLLFVEKYVLSEIFEDNEVGRGIYAWNIDDSKNLYDISFENVGENEAVDIRDILSSYGFSLFIDVINSDDHICRCSVMPGDNIKSLSLLVDYDSIKNAITQF